VNILK